MTFDDALNTFSEQLKYSAINVAQGNRVTVDQLRQEGRIWVFQNLDYISGWHAKHGEQRAKDLVYQSLKRRMVDYVMSERAVMKDTILATDRAAMIAANESGRAHGDVVGDDRVFTDPITPEPGTEAMFPASGDMTDYLLRCFAAEFMKLDKAKRDLLMDVYLDRLSLAEAARARNVSTSYIGRECRKYIQEALKAAQERVSAHPVTEVPAGSPGLHSASQGYWRAA